MILSKLYIKNFLSYGENDNPIDFSDHGLICLSGQNGHGKSALLDAITWSIWGFARKTMGSAKNDESLIRLGEKSMEVSIEFFVNDVLYQITRKATIQYKKCSTELFFKSIESGTNLVLSDLAEAAQKDTQVMINQIIGFDYETFINSAYFKQGQSNEFSKKTAHERKDILCKLMKLDHLEEIRELVLSDIREFNQELSLLDLRIADYTREKTQYTDLSLKKESFLKKKELYTQTKTYVDEEKKNHQEYLETYHIIIEIRILEDQLLSLKKQHQEQEEKLKQYELSFNDYSTISANHSKQKNRFEIIEKKINNYYVNEATLNEKIKDIEYTLNELKKENTRCFACKTSLNIEQQQILLTELIISKEESINKIKFIEQQKKNGLIIQKKVSQEIILLEKKIEEKKYIHILYEKLSQEYHKTAIEIQKFTEKINLCKKNIPNIEINFDLSLVKKLEQKEKNLIVLYEELAEEYAILKHAFEKSQTLTEDIIRLQEEKKKKQSDLLIREDLSFILGKDALQASILESLIPVLEYEANKILSKLTNDDYKLYIESTKDLKSGKTKETLEIMIEDSCGKRPYECFSGGEAFRIDLSLRLAITRLIGIYTNRKLETLIIDEGFGSQDGTGLEYIIDCLHVLQQEFKKIIVVSHLPTMKDLFPIHLHVYKTSKGSMVQYI